jgi:hypothetical protein
MGGSAGANAEATETLKWIAEARREQLVLYTDSEATGAELNSPRRAVLGAVGVRQHSAVWVSVVGTVLSTAAGNPCPILSRTAWLRYDLCLVSHSAVSSHRSATVAGVVGRVSWT